MHDFFLFVLFVSIHSCLSTWLFSKDVQCESTFWLTCSNTGLLLLMSLMPTMTWAELLRGRGPPAMLSSVAVTFSTYCGPRSLGGGLRRSLIIPSTNTARLHCKEDPHVNTLLFKCLQQSLARVHSRRPGHARTCTAP